MSVLLKKNTCVMQIAGKSRNFWLLLVTSYTGDMQIVFIVPSLGSNLASSISYNSDNLPLILYQLYSHSPKLLCRGGWRRHLCYKCSEHGPHHVRPHAHAAHCVTAHRVREGTEGRAREAKTVPSDSGSDGPSRGRQKLPALFTARRQDRMSCPRTPCL